ncbi:phage recombination protein Bet [Companilactobacillus nantensis]|uniref:Phage recombination protein Bet n=1 Tax=Companilactobacillus nantensis DSM 16982 TaxID=1423774 RepID=A0A0R1WQA3_9LACO|nr:phage recombination protein Bet [Companilactobacillus nantensis]KRM17286.1 phage recombination protein Bet [Companilactobacillus nantensis DSM 16982]GEO63983.1 hypothetical protein LNA01_11660 [Companilactobacillus nantensis]
MANEVTKNETKEPASTVFEVGGQKVELNRNIVKTFIKSGNGNITDGEASMFIALCKYQHLNPFLNEAYLVKFGNSPAQQIVSKEAFMKRAEQNEHFKGMKAGCIVLRNNEVINTNGAFVLPTDELVGGWAEVNRDDRDTPVHIEISYKEFNKGQSTWKSMPANMIRKTAIVNALREAFPNDLGAMYTEDDGNSAQESVSNTRHEAPVEPKKNLDDLVGNVSNKPEQADKPVKDVTPDPVKESNSMSDEEAKRAYDEIKNGGIDDDAETGKESEAESDGQTDLFK